ncbi:MAG: class I SAM-dependent methyltransferase [Saprospiraceae bacterium]|nr:class I SAM-dependent methyltransferase [Saprospiraceae bacterium]
MPNKPWQALATLQFYYQAKTVYQVHSPLAYKLISLVEDVDKHYYFFDDFAEIRQQVSMDSTRITRMDFGTGPLTNASTTIRRFAGRAALPKSRGEAYFRLMTWKKPAFILELGTALGYSAAYLGAAHRRSAVHTLEGDPFLANYARDVFAKLGLENIAIHPGPIEKVLPSLLPQLPPIDVVHMDANHTYLATMEYFRQIKPHLSADAMIIMDDIRWSRGMLQAWKEIIREESKSLAVEFDQWGLLSLNAPVKESIHIRSIPTQWKPWTVLRSI